VRRKDGDVVTINTCEFDGAQHSVHNMSRARKGRRSLRSAPRSLGQPAEFNGRIG